MEVVIDLPSQSPAFAFLYLLLLAVLKLDVEVFSQLYCLVYSRLNSNANRVEVELARTVMAVKALA